MTTQELINPSTADLIRETIIVVFGLVIRFFELKKRKEKDAGSF